MVDKIEDRRFLFMSSLITGNRMGGVCMWTNWNEIEWTIHSSRQSKWCLAG